MEIPALVASTCCDIPRSRRIATIRSPSPSIRRFTPALLAGMYSSCTVNSMCMCINAMVGHNAAQQAVSGPHRCMLMRRFFNDSASLRDVKLTHLTRCFWRRTLAGRGRGGGERPSRELASTVPVLAALLAWSPGFAGRDVLQRQRDGQRLETGAVQPVSPVHGAGAPGPPEGSPKGAASVAARTQVVSLQGQQVGGKSGAVQHAGAKDRSVAAFRQHGCRAMLHPTRYAGRRGWRESASARKRETSGQRLRFGAFARTAPRQQTWTR